MKVMHRMVGDDRRTDRMKARFEIPSGRLAEVKRIAGVASDDPDAAWSYPLSADHARAVAGLPRASIAPDRPEFFSNVRRSGGRERCGMNCPFYRCETYQS